MTNMTTANEGRLLGKRKLDDYLQLYHERAAGEDQDEVPILEEEEFVMICNVNYVIIEDLLEHICC